MDKETLEDLYDAGLKSGRSAGWFEATAALWDIVRATKGAEYEALKAAWTKLTESRDARLTDQS